MRPLPRQKCVPQGIQHKGADWFFFTPFRFFRQYLEGASMLLFERARLDVRPLRASERGRRA